MALWFLGTQLLIKASLQVLRANFFSDLLGESIPVSKNLGEELISGTLLTNGVVHMQAQKVGTVSYASSMLQFQGSTLFSPK